MSCKQQQQEAGRPVLMTHPQITSSQPVGTVPTNQP